MPSKLTDLPLDITAVAIGQYLTEKEKSTLAAVSQTTQGLFQPARLQKMANKLLLQVMHGEQEKAATILKIHPELLTMTGTATDYSGRTFKTTAFRYALWSLDTRYMCNMMLDCLPYSEQGEAIKQDLLMQFKTQEQDGLDYELNGMTIHEAHYDFSPITAALETYIDEYDNWFANNNLDSLRSHWWTAVGLAQRYFPAHVAQHYCDREVPFYRTPRFNKTTFKRSLEFLNYNTNTFEFWFTTVSPTSTSGLGIDIGLFRGGMPSAVTDAVVTTSEDDLAALDALCEVRTSDLLQLMQRLESPIQMPVAVPMLG